MVHYQQNATCDFTTYQARVNQMIVINSNIVCMELYYKSNISEIVAKPFAKRNKRKQDRIEQISENTIHQIIIVYYKSRLVPANFLKRSLL